jgi:hypothetical protein
MAGKKSAAKSPSPQKTLASEKTASHPPRPSALVDTCALKKTGSDWHASHYVKVMLDQIFWKYEQSNIQNN